MGYRVLALIAVMLLVGCAKKESGCATPATQTSLAQFVNSYVHQHHRLGEHDPLDTGLLKVTRFEAFETTRQDEERDRTSCRAIVQFDVEGTAMPVPIEYDLLPSGGDTSDGEADTVVSMELPLAAVIARLKNGVLADLRQKEGSIGTLANMIDKRERLFMALGSNLANPQAKATKDELDARVAELKQTKEAIARIRESLRAGRAGR